MAEISTAPARRKTISLTDEQEIVEDAQCQKMNSVIGDFVTGLTATGMDESLAIQYVASILIQAGVGLLCDFVIAPDSILRNHVRQRVEEKNPFAHIVGRRYTLQEEMQLYQFIGYKGEGMKNPRDVVTQVIPKHFMVSGGEAVLTDGQLRLLRALRCVVERWVKYQSLEVQQLFQAFQDAQYKYL
jgi:hypothetical protein